MRGVVKYAADPTVAILDSERVGEKYGGIPIVGTVADALAYEPTTALVGVATQGGRFPPAWRELLKQCIAAGLDVENGLHVMLGCMIESGLGIAAAAQIASLCDHVDLDGNLLIARDPWRGLELVDGIQTPADAPGLGVEQALPDPR